MNKLQVLLPTITTLLTIICWLFCTLFRQRIRIQGKLSWKAHNVAVVIFSSTGLEFAFNMLSILAADVLRVSVLGVHPLGSPTGVGIHTNLQI